ncbi:MAG TPA: arylsulfotransferase family protein [Solirubrobacteraceae bacterium]
MSVFPSPGTRFATPQTQISFRGVPRRALGVFTVTGSRSGVHHGHVTPDSDGRGASFYPSRRFAAGELVTVRTALPIRGGRAGRFAFRIDRLAAPVPQGRRVTVPRVPGDVEAFHSRPDLRPASVQITFPRPGAPDLFLASMHGPLQWGPMIVDSRGSLVWFKPIHGPRSVAADVRVQEYRGHPVLTWWQGIQNYGNPAPNEDVIVNRRYQTIATVRAGNGLTTDLHEFTITPQNTALITAYRPVRLNAHHMPVLNCFVQEIDIRTGNVLFQWDSLDHIPVADTYGKPSPFGSVDDYFHINSVAQAPDGNFVISGRDTWAIYKIDHRTGRVLWELGGKHSSFTMGPGTRTVLQHDATIHPGGLITIFDNEDWGAVPAQSRVVLEQIDAARHTVTLIRQLDDSPSLFSPWEGSAQLLVGGQVFVDWGGLPEFTEFDRGGRETFAGRFTGGTSSYRAYEHAWNAQPATRPAVAVSRNAGAETVVYASWNGATDVARWRVLAGEAPGSLTQVAVAPRSGFETAITVRQPHRYFAVQALSDSGRALAESPAVPH